MKEKMVLCACTGLPCSGDCRNENLDRERRQEGQRCPSAFDRTITRKAGQKAKKAELYDWKEVIRQYEQLTAQF